MLRRVCSRSYLPTPSLLLTHTRGFRIHCYGSQAVVAMSIDAPRLYVYRPTARIESYGVYAVEDNGLDAPLLLAHRQSARIQCYGTHAVPRISLGTSGFLNL